MAKNAAEAVVGQMVRAERERTDRERPIRNVSVFRWGMASYSEPH